VPSPLKILRLAHKMNTRSQITILPKILRLLLLSGPLATAQAQGVSIPDPGLNAAILPTLGRPRPSTAQDLLNLPRPESQAHKQLANLLLGLTAKLLQNGSMV
jgi:hypothetical protein